MKLLSQETLRLYLNLIVYCVWYTLDIFAVSVLETFLVDLTVGECCFYVIVLRHLKVVLRKADQVSPI